MKHVAIIPACNEASYIHRSLKTLLQQTVPPDRIIVVDDGSTDATPDIVHQLAVEHPSIRLLPGPGDKTRGYRVVDVFNVGYNYICDLPFEFISKLDADILFPPHYYERLFCVFDADPSIAVAGGALYERIHGRLTRLRTPRDHVLGAVKTYRREVFDGMGGFVPVLGWDIVDLVKVRTLGYRSQVVDDLSVTHLRRHGAATGILRGNVRMGRAAYIIGSHPLFAMARSIYRMLEPPYILGGAALGLGYIDAWLNATERLDDPELVSAVRSEQLYRLVHWNRTPVRQR